MSGGGAFAARDELRNAKCVVNAAYKGLTDSPFDAIQFRPSGLVMKHEVVARDGKQRCSNWSNTAVDTWLMNNPRASRPSFVDLGVSVSLDGIEDPAYGIASPANIAPMAPPPPPTAAMDPPPLPLSAEAMLDVARLRAAGLLPYPPGVNPPPPPPPPPVRAAAAPKATPKATPPSRSVNWSRAGHDVVRLVEAIVTLNHIVLFIFIRRRNADVDFESIRRV